MKFSDIPDSGLVQNGKKKEEWYKVYKLTEQQEEQWRSWALQELRKICADEEGAKEVFRNLDILYGFIRRYTKKGELF